MVVRGVQAVAAVAAAVILVGASTGATVRAEEAVLVPGATVFKEINPLYPEVAKSYPNIGVHFRDDDDAQIVEYSQNALDSNRAIQQGVQQTIAAVNATDGDVVVIGESMGAMVVSRVAAQWQEDPAAPRNIRFVLIASPEVGVAEYFKVGTYIPILNYRVSRVPQSEYPTTVVIGEYDGWSDPPDRPWRLTATANALMGIVFVHGPPIAAADPATVPAENITRVGNVTTYLVPTRQLPLTQPLRLIGVPDRVVDEIDRILRPIIDAAYVRHDKPGDSRLFLADGELRRNPPVGVVDVPEEPVGAAGDIAPGGAAELAEPGRRSLGRDPTAAGMDDRAEPEEVGPEESAEPAKRSEPAEPANRNAPEESAEPAKRSGPERVEPEESAGPAKQSEPEKGSGPERSEPQESRRGERSEPVRQSAESRSAEE